MARIMKTISILSGLMTLIFASLYGILNIGFIQSMAITSGTVFYHFTVRIAVGYICDKLIRGDIYSKNKIFSVSEFEMSIYSKLKVKKWKKFVPTYDAEQFNPRMHTWEEILRSICKSEIIHSINAVLSFLPVAASAYFGSFPVFLITSTVGAGFDMMFVAVQRFNRERIQKSVKKIKKHK